MILSAEQLSIVYSEEDVILVDAFAGTGKTSTLISFAEERFSSNILYLVYNKEMRKDSKRKFPLNTEVHTINSFIYKKLKDKFVNRQMINEYNINFVINNIPAVKGLIKNNEEKGIQICVDILSIINSYLNSNQKQEEFFSEDISNMPNFLAGELVKSIYSENSYLPITHDFLMKYFLDNFDFKDLKYDFVLIDEAQDINPAMLNIVNKIKAKKIFVGDKRQNIYGFRNSINIFKEKKFADIEPLKLTGSFRFGENIAFFVNQISEKLYKQPMELKGLSKEPDYVILDTEEELKGPYTAYISRTNAHLFDKAFELMDQGKKISIPFDWELIKQLVLDVFYLKNGLYNKIKSKQLKEYQSYAFFQKLNDCGANLEMSFLLRIVEKYNLEIPDLIKKLECQLASPKFADIILITAHKSKGLEFYNVEIGNDFPEASFGLPFEEKNLIYVSLTRAMEKLKLNKNLLEYLQN